MFLLLAIVAEVAGTTCMKLSGGFSKSLPTALMFLFYIVSLSALTVAVKRIEISTAYAVWSGLGVTLIICIGIVFFREMASFMKTVSIVLIVIGVIRLHLSNSR